MKIVLTALGCCLLLILLSFFQQTNSSGGLSQEDQMLYAFIRQTAKTLEKKYDLKQCGSGLGGPKKLRLITVAFEKKGEPLTEEQARELIVHCVDDFLKAINSNEDLKPLLENYPFEPKNLSLKIFNYTPEMVYHYYPHIFVVSSNTGLISFLTKVPEKEYGYYTEKEESYEEAVAILKKNQVEANRQP